MAPIVGELPQVNRELLVVSIGADFLELARAHRLHGAVGAHRHEGRRLHRAVREGERAAARLDNAVVLPPLPFAVREGSEREGELVHPDSIQPGPWDPALFREFLLEEGRRRR